MAQRLPEPEPVHSQNPVPVDRAVMLQSWHDLASVHWRYPPEIVQALLPDGYRVDTFDGSAWVGLLPFHMRRIRVPHLPAFGPLSTFPETNIRTYLVDRHGRRGVWFVSLDITRLIPALVARVSYRLPYCWAAMDIGWQRRRVDLHLAPSLAPGRGVEHPPAPCGRTGAAGRGDRPRPFPHRPLGPRHAVRPEAHVGCGRPRPLADPPRRTARGRRDPAGRRRAPRTRGGPGRAVVAGRRRPHRDAPRRHWNQRTTGADGVRSQPLVAKVFTTVVLGRIHDHEAEMRSRMQATLERLKVLVETEA